MHQLFKQHNSCFFMYIPKKYGQGKVDRCPFCQKQSTIVNRQQVPVCHSHKDKILEDLKCICGSSLDILNGKFGVFFSCMKCGNMNMRKMIELNTINPKGISEKTHFQKTNPKNTAPFGKKTTMTVRNDDPRYFD